MCCRACPGYEKCKAEGKLTEDCCPRCKYYEICMEELEGTISRAKTRGGAIRKKKYFKR